MDVLSDVLRTIRLEGALFLHADFHEPWCVDAPASAMMAPAFQAPSEPLAICHLVAEGSCWGRLPGGEAVLLEAGDVLVLPHGDAHLIGSGPGHAPMSLEHVVQLRVPELSGARYGGQGDRTSLICGWFSYERSIANPLIAALPAIFRSPLGGTPSADWIQASIRHVAHEAATGQPGSSVIAAKVAETLFVESLRRYIQTLPARETGWLAGVRDPQIGRCLTLLHAEPARAWTVAALADAVHVSRSVLADRFQAMVHVPPMQYLKRWRLALAARLLSDGRLNLARVCEAVGYESEAAFNRAFKKEYGLAPGQWRRAGEARVAPA
jgi:AraC-like DNA-binding protein